MTKFAEWLLSLVKQLLKDVVDLLVDVFIKILDFVLTALLTIIQAIPVPQFMTDGLQGILSSLPSEVWFFLSHMHIAQCFAVLTAAVTFRLARKVATLFQW